jgi:hypothetical protein
VAARWAFYGERVLWEIREASGDVQEDFRTLMYELTKDPRRAGLGVLPLKDGTGGQYSVPFDNAVLVYEILADHPWIHLLHVAWTD